MFLERGNYTILDELDKLVHGHQQAKIALINLVNRSKLRFKQKYLQALPKSEWINPINMLLVGDSGTGKTHLVQSLAKVCNFPLVIVDANQLAPVSASGITQRKLATMIIDNANSLIEAHKDKYFSVEGTVSQTVVFVDEIDKLAKSFDGSGNWNRHVQASFLTIFEDMSNDDELSDLSFVFAGAFSDMKKRHADDTKTTIGFHGKHHQSNNSQTKDFDIEAEVIKYGLLPELIGRISNIVVLDKLEEKDYIAILDNLIIPKAAKDLKHFGIHRFTVPEDKKKEIVEKAIESSMGVRVLHKEILKETQSLEFDYEWDFLNEGESE